MEQPILLSQTPVAEPRTHSALEKRPAEGKGFPGKLIQRLRRPAVRMLQSLRLNRVAHRVYYRYLHGFRPGQPEVLDAVARALEVHRGNGAVGDYYEFGIFKGYTFWYAQRMARQIGLDAMRFYGFDSFSGLPEIIGPDKTAHGEFYHGQYACAKELVIRRLSTRGVDWKRTFLIDGYFSETLTDDLRRTLEMKPIGVALIDCDLHSSTSEVLRFIEPLLVDGSILLFDDWNCFNRDDRHGQRLAFREFLGLTERFRFAPMFDYGCYGTAFRVELRVVKSPCTPVS